MSFSSEVKEELLAHTSGGRHCQIAELTALLLLSGVRLEPVIRIQTENFRVAKKISTLIYRLFHADPEIRVRTYHGTRAASVYELAAGTLELDEQIRKACKLKDRSRVNQLIIQKDCCKRAFLRGAFLVSGSVNSPEKAYHFEISCNYPELAEEIQELFRFFELEAKVVKRKKSYVVYLKEGTMIVDALNVIEAHRALMNMESVRVVKEVRNHTNRSVNCEVANLNKTISAARRQLEDIQYIYENKGFACLNDGLRQVAELRMEEPDLSLKELGERVNPPVSKSGVNHRLRKLSEVAQELRDGRR